MTFTDEAVRPRGRRGVRSWSIAAVVAGAVLVPAGPAVADHMPGMTNGTMCPHASGEGPDSLAAAGPGESGGPARAPSEQPITAPGTTTTAPAPVTDTSRPASEVSQPARTKVQVEQPATRVAQPAPAQVVAQAAEPVAARTPVRARIVTPAKAGTPKAKRVTPRAGRAARPAFERRFNGLEPRVGRGSALTRELVAPRPSAPAPSTPLLLVLGIATLAAIGGAIVAGRRRGGAGEATVTSGPTPPATPSYAELSLEAELHEIVAEAKARALLGEGPGDRGSPDREPAAHR